MTGSFGLFFKSIREFRSTTAKKSKKDWLQAMTRILIKIIPLDFSCFCRQSVRRAKYIFDSFYDLPAIVSMGLLRRCGEVC